MFEIRIICDPDDTDAITTALAGAFTVGTPRAYPTRDGMRTRLYLTARIPRTHDNDGDNPGTNTAGSNPQ
ncbi:hypothetical protein [Streptomyces daghestanicus]|uniref:Uncharacterized protein n=1 Tax=Streptomyces daghestanicus TaxID=66885 RepID=A0ABQ3Q2S4_9ACTN|nr:hypothetical protein [Streptomyces daghestanicus]GGU20632.1 hypothetical protein GCM10010259_08610 [Streptomyces daghestanicus]GHI31583.1 hypothetical protein Sdagh_33130 [Streptomyces daghestanicus]